MEEILLDLCEPYQLIAKTKKIQFEMDILDDISV